MTGKQAVAVEEKPHGYEFGGPIGTSIITFGLPLFLYALVFGCNDISGCPAPALLHPRTLDLATLKREVGWPEEGIWGLCSWEVFGWTIAYYGLSAVLYAILPAQEVDGTKLANGGRLKYRLNTFSSTMCTLTLCAAGTVMQGAEFPVWKFMTDNFVQIMTANIIIAYALAIFVYVRSFSVKPGNPELRLLAAGGQTGNMIYDFYIGRELNPRVTLPLIGEIDIKEWMELRPGMMGWMLFNFANIAKQYRNFGYVTDSIIFISIIQAVYIIDSQVVESYILTTMDITTDGFGFMLSFGDLVWVPFFYSTQTRYLATHPQTLGKVGLIVVGSVLAIGYSIFRMANSEKNAFRNDPNHPSVSHLKYIETKTGSRLLTSGWWGIARHINYFGDWIQSFPYSLPTGFAGYVIAAAGTQMEGAVRMLDGRVVAPGEAKGWGMIFTYFYILYFAILLVHRERRDDEKCHRKYGADWEKYKSAVRWRIIPYVY